MGKATKISRQEELAKIFKMAIKAEQRAQKMYQNALAFCDHEELKEILIGLYEDEARHEKEITGLYKELAAFFQVKEGIEHEAPKKPGKGSAKNKAGGR